MIRGRDKSMLGQSAEAIVDLKRSLKINPHLLAAYTGLTNVYLDLGRNAEAVAVMEQGMKSVPAAELDHNLYRERGEIYTILKQYDKARLDVDRSLKMNPAHADNWITSSNLSYAMGKYDRAVADITKAIKLHPSETRLYGIRSKIYLKMGKVDEAKKDGIRATPGEIDF